MTVTFFQAPVRAPLIILPRPCRIAGKSVGFGGVNSTAAYFKKVWNFGRPWTSKPLIMERKNPKLCNFYDERLCVQFKSNDNDFSHLTFK